MTGTKPQSASLARRMVDVLLAGIGVLIAGHYVLGYQWPVWEKTLVLLAIVVLVSAITWAQWTLPRRR
jgi:hypothetical protein